MKRKALVLAIAGALSAPSAWAATDTSGMQFTSASEGFYASVRARYNSGGSKSGSSNIENSSSRFGVRGTNDLGGGLGGFYQYEAGVSIDNGGDLSTRIGEVGLRGDFGEFRIGSFWTNDYNWVHGSTDIANVNSGNLVYTDSRRGRAAKTAQYTTPNLNGFQGALRLEVNGADDKNDVDAWNIAGTYNIQGFTVAGSYNQRPDGLKTLSAGGGADGNLATTGGANTPGRNTNIAGATRDQGTDDASAWTIRLGYAQDNWYINGWYGEDNTSDRGYINGAVAANADRAKYADQEIFSIAGGVAIDKVNLYAVYETADNAGGISELVKDSGVDGYGNLVGSGGGRSGVEHTRGTVGVQYNLGAQTRTWIEYASQDNDANADADDYVTIGLQHNF